MHITFWGHYGSLDGHFSVWNPVTQLKKMTNVFCFIPFLHDESLSYSSSTKCLIILKEKQPQIYVCMVSARLQTNNIVTNSSIRYRNTNSVHIKKQTNSSVKHCTITHVPRPTICHCMHRHTVNNYIQTRYVVIPKSAGQASSACKTCKTC